MRNALRATAIATVVLGLALSAPTAGHAAEKKLPQRAPAAPCKVSDGWATSGVSWGSNPPKYEYGNSPYVGAQYNSCTDVTRVYYGGYSNLTHYNVIYGSRQYELRAGPRMVWTVTPASFDHQDTFTVQGCIRGSWPNPSSCTRWSPTVHLNVIH